MVTWTRGIHYHNNVFYGHYKRNPLAVLLLSKPSKLRPSEDQRALQSVPWRQKWDPPCMTQIWNIYNIKNRDTPQNDLSYPQSQKNSNVFIHLVACHICFQYMFVYECYMRNVKQSWLVCPGIFLSFLTSLSETETHQNEVDSETRPSKRVLVTKINSSPKISALKC